MSAFFNHAGASPPTDAVVERMIRQLRREQEIGGYEAAAEVVDELGVVRSDIGRAVGASADEVALTAGATDAWERAIWSFLSERRFADGATVVVDPFTYSSMWSTLQRWSDLRPLRLIVTAAAPDGTADIDSLAVAADETTAAVLLTHIPTHLGTVTDAAGAIATARTAAPDALIALDVAQSVGQLPLDLHALDCDVAFAPGRKFLRGPRGTGFLYVRRATAESLVPLALPFGATLDPDGTFTGIAPGALRFEVFERPIAALLGLGVAVRQLLDLGVDEVARRVMARTDDVRSVLAAHPALSLCGTPGDRGIVTFRHERLQPADVGAQLARLDVASRIMPTGAPMADGRGAFDASVRLSPHECTTDAELAHLDRALRQLS